MATLTTWLSTLALVLLLGCAHLLDGPADWEDQQNQAANARQALAQQRASIKLAKAAQDVCGPNAAYEWADDGHALQCMTKRGRKTHKATL